MGRFIGKTQDQKVFHQYNRFTVNFIKYTRFTMGNESFLTIRIVQLLFLHTGVPRDYEQIAIMTTIRSCT